MRLDSLGQGPHLLRPLTGASRLLAKNSGQHPQTNADHGTDPGSGSDITTCRANSGTDANAEDCPDSDQTSLDCGLVVFFVSRRDSPSR